MHPIVAQMRVSDEQRPAVIDRGHDIVVTAGAGTGKTRTLVARYLSLLAEGVELRTIVAITFTRKAAREMRNRVRDQIRRYLEQGELQYGERQRWLQLYGELDAARIYTIHGLCTEILRSHPAEAQVDPRFTVLEEGTSNILRNQAVAEALAWAANEPKAAGLFGLLGAEELRKAVRDLLQRRLDAAYMPKTLTADTLTHWRRILTGRQERCLQRLLSRREWADAASTLIENQAHRADDLMELQRREALAALESARGSYTAQVNTLRSLTSIRLTGGSQSAWPGGKEQLVAVKEALRTLRDLWRGQCGLLELALNPLDEAVAGALPSLHDTLQQALQRLDAFKQESNALDYDDLEYKALRLLREYPEARAYWQSVVQAILVDEFQDTNQRQRDLVNLINSGGKLFIVGDAKQSIYGFRGADVVVFREERERIERTSGPGHSLKVSYRAHHALVQGLNDLLQPVLGDAADPERPWVEPFAKLEYSREEPGPGFAGAPIELHLGVGAKDAGALKEAARALARRIDSLKHSEMQVIVDGKARPLDYGDFAILCRASTSFAEYENALEEAGVPFLTVAGRGFYGRPEIRDLMNALRAIADPTDDLALVGLLRSPVIGLTDTAIYHLCRAWPGPKQMPLWDLVRDGQAGNDLPVEDRQRSQRAVRLVTWLHERAGRTAVADLLKDWLDATDYRAALIQAGQARAARNVAKLLADAHASNIVGVGEFLEYAAALRDAGTREGEARSTADGAVQIMSVHAAKGLEFPVVAIGDVTHSRQGSRGLLVDRELGILLPLKDEEKQSPASYLLGKMRADDMEEAESDRLFYVAATRAQEKLILSGYVDASEAGTLSKTRGWLSKIAGPDALGLEGMPAVCDHPKELQIGSTHVTCTLCQAAESQSQCPTAKERQAEQDVTVPLPLLRVIPCGEQELDRPLIQQERIPAQRVWRVVPTVRRPEAPAWVVGSLVHEALAAWRFPEDHRAWDVQHSWERWAEARARGYGLADPGQLANAVQRSAQLLVRFRAHRLYEEMAGADQRVHEVPYSLEVDGRVESGVIDVLYRRGADWTLVEFKTDELRDELELQRLLLQEDYVPQARRYEAAVARLLGQKPRVVLCLLNVAGTVRERTII